MMQVKDTYCPFCKTKRKYLSPHKDSTIGYSAICTSCWFEYNVLLKLL